MPKTNCQAAMKFFKEIVVFYVLQCDLHSPEKFLLAGHLPLPSPPVKNGRISAEKLHKENAALKIMLDERAGREKEVN